MDDLPDRVRSIIGDDPNIGEIRMFGGICFMLNGNMLVGTMKNDTLLVRVGAEGMDAALARPAAARMDMAGRTMSGFVVVDGAALDDAALRGWIATATTVVGPMPPKEKSERKARGKRAR